MRIFLSHSSKNAKEAEAVCRVLEQAGHKCFLAPRDIPSGREYAEEIVNGIDSSSAVVLLLSEAANSSPHVLREIERAVSKKLSIIVYKLEDVELSKSMEYFLMTHQWVNEKSDKGYKEILSCINGLEDKNAAAGAELKADEKKKPDKKGFAVKTAAVAAAAAVLVIVSVLIISGINRPEDVMKGNLLTENGGGASDTEKRSDVSESAPETVSSSDLTSAEEPLQTSSEISTEAETKAEASVSESTAQSVSVSTVQTVSESTADSETFSASSSETREETSVTVSESETAAEDLNTAAPAGEIPQAELGDSFIMGEYLGEPIKWRIIQISDDEKTAVVIADKILTFKAFDAAEGGKYNSYGGENYWNVPPWEMTGEIERLVRGDNRWELSNLRTWLNSDKDNVTYTDTEPSSRAMSELKNGYNTEPGFLKSFKKSELSAILTTEVNTDGTVTEDRVYLLSRDELALLDEADVSVYALPTQSAVDQDQSGWFSLNVNEYKVRDHYWWLREPNTDTASEVYIVNNSYTGERIFSHNVGLEGYGVRPVVTVDLTAVELDG